MLKQKMMLVMLGMIFLSGCSVPEITVEQCFPFMAFKVEDGRRYIDEDRSACFCRSYKYSLDYVGPVGEFTESDILLCQKVIGHRPDAYNEVNNWIETVRKKAAKIKSRKSKPLI